MKEKKSEKVRRGEERYREGVKGYQLVEYT